MFIFILVIKVYFTGFFSNRESCWLLSSYVPFCLIKLVYFFLAGRLLSRSNTKKPDAVYENGKEETMKNIISKKRKIEVADCEVEIISLELETPPGSAENKEHPPEFSNYTNKPVL